MTFVSQPFFARVGQHWFVPAALLIVAGALTLAQTADWPREAQLLEGALLFDLAILLPLLFWFCYRLKAKAIALRAAAMACGGIWLATYLVPSEHQVLLPTVAFLRYGAIAVLLYIEIRVVAALYWAVIAGRVPADQIATHLAEKAGIPLGLATIMAKEALFWKRLLARPIAFIRKHFGRGD